MAWPVSHRGRAAFHAAAGCLTAALLAGATIVAQRGGGPTNDLPNPYQSIENAFTLPDGRTWGSVNEI